MKVVMFQSEGRAAADQAKTKKQLKCRSQDREALANEAFCQDTL